MPMHEKMKTIDLKGARKIPHSQIPSLQLRNQVFGKWVHSNVYKQNWNELHIVFLFFWFK